MCMYFLLDIVWVSSLITFHRLERERGGEREGGERKGEEGEKERGGRERQTERGEIMCVFLAYEL